jgi:hypothetical protein
MTHRGIAYRLSLLVALLALYYAWDWMPVRFLQRDATAWLLQQTGYNPIRYVYEGSPAIFLKGKTHHYSATCTYLAPLLIAAPFIWVFGASRRSNIGRTAITTLIILGGNLVRCWASVYLAIHGMARLYAHDLPNYAFGVCVVAIPVLASLRRDFGHQSASSPATHVAYAACKPYNAGQSPIGIMRDSHQYVIHMTLGARVGDPDVRLRCPWSVDCGGAHRR